MTRDPAQATGLCHACPKLCRFACPVAEACQDESTTPWGKMSTMKLTDQGVLPFDEKSARQAYLCLNCRASEEVCELGNPVPETLDTYRVRAFERGLAPPAVFEFVRRFRDHTNPFRRDLHEVLEKEYPLEMKRPVGRTVYLPGCVEIRHFPETIGKALRLLRKEDPSLSLYREPIQCCGYPLYVAGELTGFRDLAEINYQALKRFRTLISGTPACLYTLETLYRQQGFSLPTRFLHVAEVLKVPSRSPSRQRAGRVAYHDPCYLGRYRGVYDPPRRLIQQATGREVVEFFRRREGSYCCGAGALLPVSAPATASKITENRLQEFERLGADLLVSACPSCVQRFESARPTLKVKGLVDFLSS